MQKLTWEAVSLWRLENQHLQKPLPAENMLTAVQALGGVQAQVMTAAELAISARVANLSKYMVRNALWKNRTLIKSWFMRGTLHILASEDYPLYIAAFRTLKKHYMRNSWYKYFGVSPEELQSYITAIGAILTDEGMTREQLADKIVEATNLPQLREKLRSGWGTLLKPPSFQGMLCYAPSEGQNVCFVQPKAWIGEWEDWDSDEAFQELVRRFLHAYGAAPMPEFARWLGIAKTDAKKVIKGMMSELIEVDVEGWQALALPEMLEHQAKSQGHVNLLGHFDPYTIMIAPQADYLMSQGLKSRVYNAQGWIFPVVLYDGRVVGLWKQESKGRQNQIHVEIIEDKGKELWQGIEAEVQRLSAFLGTDIEFTYRQ